MLANGCRVPVMWRGVQGDCITFCLVEYSDSVLGTSGQLPGLFTTPATCSAVKVILPSQNWARSSYPDCSLERSMGTRKVMQSPWRGVHSLAEDAGRTSWLDSLGDDPEGRRVRGDGRARLVGPDAEHPKAVLDQEVGDVIDRLRLIPEKVKPSCLTRLVLRHQSM